MADDQDTNQEQKNEEQADLELQDEQADEVKGGGKHFLGGADRGPDMAKKGRF